MRAEALVVDHDRTVLESTRQLLRRSAYAELTADGWEETLAPRAELEWLRFAAPRARAAAERSEG